MLHYYNVYIVFSIILKIYDEVCIFSEILQCVFCEFDIIGGQVQGQSDCLVCKVPDFTGPRFL